MDEKSTSTYLDGFKQKQVEKLLDFIEWVEHNSINIDKNKIRQVAEELGIAESFLHKKLKELDNYKYAT